MVEGCWFNKTKARWVNSFGTRLDLTSLNPSKMERVSGFQSSASSHLLPWMLTSQDQQILTREIDRRDSLFLLLVQTLLHLSRWRLELPQVWHLTFTIMIWKKDLKLEFLPRRESAASFQRSRSTIVKSQPWLEEQFPKTSVENWLNQMFRLLQKRPEEILRLSQIFLMLENLWLKTTLQELFLTRIFLNQQKELQLKTMKSFSRGITGWITRFTNPTSVTLDSMPRI